MSKLSWISDQALERAIEKLQESSENALHKVADRQERNVIDPFLSLIMASTFKVSKTSKLLDMQSMKSTGGGISNALGHFHQQILGSVNGWDNHDAGYDLECTGRQILAEVKNKHNTMNHSNRLRVTSDLDTAVRQKGRGWQAYLVIVIPKTLERYEKHLINERRPVYEIDGTSFYEKVTGQATALHDLFHVLCNNLATSKDISKYCLEVILKAIPE